MSDGEMLVSNEHICAVEETFYKDIDFTTIIGYCVRSHSIRKDPYKITFEISKERNVTYRHCSCLGGGGGLCKHACAMYTWVNQETAPGKTDKPMEWNKPSKYAQKLYRELKTIFDLWGGREFTPDFLPTVEKIKRQMARMEKHKLTVCSFCFFTGITSHNMDKAVSIRLDQSGSNSKKG